jgi:MFS family permease
VVTTPAITTTIGYGVLCYTFSALLEPMFHDLRLSSTTATGALSVSVLVSALMAVPVGRWLDQHGGRGVMSAGSALATVAVIAWSQVQSATQPYAVFVLIGVASAMVLSSRPSPSLSRSLHQRGVAARCVLSAHASRFGTANSSSIRTALTTAACR